VWLRHELETRHKRLLRLEKASHDTTFVLSNEQIELLERVDFRCRHVESSRPAGGMCPDFRGKRKMA